ncbi:MAG: hypothetical protein VR69_04390 [Peptococcaceae bacterium BRH_c4b]|nr:MAG: hypothetical protein VR69_04390 [Peptococcaceae bacterium BRH_c4b]
MRAKSLIVLMLLFTMCVIVPGDESLAGEALVEFSDTAGHWAAGSITECRANGLMSGYPDNIFKPSQSLSRVEALVTVNRAMGWSSQVNTVSTSGINFPTDLWEYFRNHVALAANKQLMIKSDIPMMKFNDPAPRIEVALWLAKALDLKGNGAGLNFTDLNKIPATSRDMVAGVVEAGIITGLPGNLFEPSKSLTRAEMASILGRLLKDKKIASPEGKYHTGQLTSVDWVNKKISVQTTSGSGTYPLAGSYMVYKDGKRTTLDAIRAGECVGITLDGSGNCIFIAIQDGTVTTSEQTSTTGSVSVSYSGNRGYIVNKYWDNFSVRFSDGSVEEFYINGVKFIEKGYSITYGALQKGTYVEVVRSGSSISEVRILEGDRKVFGEVEKISSQSIGIIDEDNRDITYTLTGGVSIKDKDNRSADIEDIEAEMDVELTLNAKDEVTALKFNETTGDLKGIVDYIRITGTKKITVEDKDGDSHTYYLANSVSVREDDRTRNLDYVDEGMNVELTLNSAKEVTRIEIKDLTVVEGEVTYISTSGTKRIKIEKSNNKEVTYYLADGVTVKDGGTSKSLSYIDTGLDVKLYLNDDDKVIRIEIIGSSSTVRGEVTSIRTSGTKRIWIKLSSGSEKNYYLSDDVKVTEGSATKNLSYIDKDMEVKLTLDDDDEVTRIDIL